MDLNLDYSDDESPLTLKSDFILSLCELLVGGKDGLQPVQKTIIDRCVRLVYQDVYKRQAELREVTSYDELELDTLGDRRTALFLIMRDVYKRQGQGRGAFQSGHVAGPVRQGAA